MRLLDSTGGLSLDGSNHFRLPAQGRPTSAHLDSLPAQALRGATLGTGPLGGADGGRRRQRRGSRRAGRAAGGTQNDDGLLSSGDARERRGIDGACRVAGPLAAVGRRLAATKCGAQLGLGGGGWRSSVPLNTERMWRVSLNDLKVLTFPTMLRARLLPARAAHARLRFRSQDRLQLPKSASGNFCIAAAGSASTLPRGGPSCAGSSLALARRASPGAALATAACLWVNNLQTASIVSRFAETFHSPHPSGIFVCRALPRAAERLLGQARARGGRAEAPARRTLWPTTSPSPAASQLSIPRRAWGFPPRQLTAPPTKAHFIARGGGGGLRKSQA